MMPADMYAFNNYYSGMLTVKSVYFIKCANYYQKSAMVFITYAWYYSMGKGIPEFSST